MDFKDLEDWLRRNRVQDVACLVPDLTGSARGKTMTPALFLNGIKNRSLRIPETVYAISVQGEIVFSSHVASTERDLVLTPDLSTIHLAPWNNDPT
ncbi:MAG: glutamine synthetase, partial [Pseudomonadota bacterium]